ncbi:hypothetical protein CSA37_13040 [Candidatus Fermentibacteria bacterium]|nr:MAG: hypothetical protein CSA37_13040 [Candidatus Fermentibacteria bacterium]
MKLTIIILTVIVFQALSYGYWDSGGYGGRILAYDGITAGLCGSWVSDNCSAFSIFSNPASLAKMNGKIISVSGHLTGWREEVSYHYTCEDPYRYNLGVSGPGFSFAAAKKLVKLP